MTRDGSPADPPRRRGGDRRHEFPGRQRRINLRLNDDEFAAIAQAAARAELTPAGFCAHAALAATHGTDPPGTPITGTSITRAELAQLQRDLFAARSGLVRAGTLFNQAVAALNATGQPSAQLAADGYETLRAIRHVDAVIDQVDRSLR